MASTLPQSPLTRESCSRLCVYVCARAECACGESSVCACMFACGVRVWRALDHKALLHVNRAFGCVCMHVLVRSARMACTWPQGPLTHECGRAGRPHA